MDFEGRSAMAQGKRAMEVWALATAILASGCAGERGAIYATGKAGTSGGSGGAGGAMQSETSAGTGGSVGTGASAGTGGKGPTTDANCGLRTFALNKLPPELLIVLDRSGSMVNPATGGSCGVTRTCGSRWVEITNAINQVVSQTQTSIRWGLKFFADVPACDVVDGAAVAIGINTAPAIATAIMAIQPGGQTPTRAAMVSAGAYLKTLADPNPKFVLLATDGEPNCLVGNPNQAVPDTDAAVASVKAVADLGFPVYVVGVATSGNVLDMTLRQMAIAGGRPRTGDPEYYPVSNSDDLVAALGKIGGQISSCTFNLGMPPPDPTNVAVNAGGARVPKDPSHKEGWDYTPGMASIDLYGTWCDKAKADTIKDVQALFGCPGMVIP